MNPLNVVLLQGDPKNVRLLAASLCHHFPAIHTAGSIAELREKIVKHRAQLAIVDMEIASMSDIEILHRDFPVVGIVCTHRLADEEMWTAALDAGAADVCPSSDTRSIVMAALHNTDNSTQPAAA
jgi:DNA-binding NarL/FixJ family response regulator